MLLPASWHDHTQCESQSGRSIRGDPPNACRKSYTACVQVQCCPGLAQALPQTTMQPATEWTPDWTRTGRWQPEWPCSTAANHQHQYQYCRGSEPEVAPSAALACEPPGIPPRILAVTPRSKLGRRRPSRQSGPPLGPPLSKLPG